MAWIKLDYVCVMHANRMQRPQQVPALDLTIRLLLCTAVCQWCVICACNGLVCAVQMTVMLVLMIQSDRSLDDASDDASDDALDVSGTAMRLSDASAALDKELQPMARLTISESDSKDASHAPPAPVRV